MADEEKAKKRVRGHLVRAALVTAAVVAVGGGYYVWVHVIRANFGVVVPGAVYRSGEPTADQMRQWAREYRIKSVINLRGDGAKTIDLDPAPDADGVRTLVITLSSRELPTREHLAALAGVLETAQRPILIRCRDGVDRTGMASALAAMAIGQEDYATAKRQAWVLPGPWKRKGGEDYIGDVFDLYERYCARSGLGTDGWAQFKRWALEVYYPHYYNIEIAAPAEVEIAPGQEANFEVRITNKSDEAIPAGSPGKSFRLITYTGAPVYRKGISDVWQGGEGETDLPPKDIQPGETIAVTHRIVAPAAAGEYQVYLDVHEEDCTSFTRQGSAPRPLMVKVRKPTSLEPASPG